MLIQGPTPQSPQGRVDPPTAPIAPGPGRFLGRQDVRFHCWWLTQPRSERARTAERFCSAVNPRHPVRRPPLFSACTSDSDSHPLPCLRLAYPRVLYFSLAWTARLSFNSFLSLCGFVLLRVCRFAPPRLYDACAPSSGEHDIARSHKAQHRALAACPFDIWLEVFW